MAQRLTVPVPDTGNLIPRIPGGTYLETLPTWTVVTVLPPIDGPRSELFPGVPWTYTFNIPYTGRYALALEFAQNNDGIGGLRLDMTGVSYELFVDDYYGFTRGTIRMFFLSPGSQVITALFLGDNHSGHLTLAGLFQVPPFVRLSTFGGATARWEVPA